MFFVKIIKLTILIIILGLISVSSVSAFSFFSPSHTGYDGFEIPSDFRPLDKKNYSEGIYINDFGELGESLIINEKINVSEQFSKYKTQKLNNNVCLFIGKANNNSDSDLNNIVFIELVEFNGKHYEITMMGFHDMTDPKNINDTANSLLTDLDNFNNLNNLKPLN